MFEHLAEPIAIGTMLLPNHMIMPAVGTNLNSPDGTVSDRAVDYYTTRANGGAGSIVTEVCTVEPGGRGIPG